MKIDNIKQLQNEVERIQQDNIKFSVRYRLHKLNQELKDINDEAEKKRIELLEKYGKLEEGQTQYIFESDEDMTNFSNEYNEVINEEIEIKESFTVNDFENVTGSGYNFIFNLITNA
ncbi:hypothetical protein [Sphingobacterium multivorum]|uniref:hypothetical protein n=1 Tax=Sphingobacterium multivorum TaxID=28454 RepID=UPI0028AE1DCB|nr:hypothetical protein [Sphingobacterium multivorum]